MKFSNWVALFSQTGTEIVELSKAIGREPDVVLTNSYAYNNKVNPNLSDKAQVICKDGAKTLDVLDRVAKDPDTLITLNGWLKIVPPAKCAKYNIYNGHPGLITKYPELKGKDPQERTWKNIASYARMGSVVHRVVAEVDDGEVVVEKSIGQRDILSIHDTYRALRKTSFDAWIEFLKEHLYNKV